jgi:hypothetical protein
MKSTMIIMRKKFKLAGRNMPKHTKKKTLCNFMMHESIKPNNMGGAKGPTP